jgi:hypothetical protein
LFKIIDSQVQINNYFEIKYKVLTYDQFSSNSDIIYPSPYFVAGQRNFLFIVAVNSAPYTNVPPLLRLDLGGGHGGSARFASHERQSESEQTADDETHFDDLLHGHLSVACELLFQTVSRWALSVRRNPAIDHVRIHPHSILRSAPPERIVSAVLVDQD